jgi:hypothetical protein
VVIGLPKEDLEARLRKLKSSLGVKDDTQVSAQGWRWLVREYKAYFKEKTKRDFPEDPEEQLWGAIGAVFESWMAEKAVTYRRVEKITGLLGTAVNVVQMVFGNTGEDSGTGVCFTRDPSTGEKTFYGDLLLNAQGERSPIGWLTQRGREIEFGSFQSLVESQLAWDDFGWRIQAEPATTGWRDGARRPDASCPQPRRRYGTSSCCGRKGGG